MNLKDLRDHPAIKAHWPEVARSIDEHLVARLLDTCTGSEGMTDRAEAEIGAARALAALIKDFRTLADGKARAPKPVSIGKTLNRFSQQPDPPKAESKS